MRLIVKPAGASIPATEMPDNIYITMLSEQILEITDLGLKVYDEINCDFASTCVHVYPA